MRSHGPFTIGVSARDAVKAAVLAEDAARTAHAARQVGPLIPLPQGAIDRLYDRYQNIYGQADDDRRGRPDTTPSDEREN
jgi:L-ribulose-5-phosphate 4-epimerase